MRKSYIKLNPYQFQILRKEMTMKEIAIQYGYNYKALQAWCSRRLLDTKRITDWELAEEIRIKTPKEISYEYNVSLKSIYYRLKKIGMNPKMQNKSR